MPTSQCPHCNAPHEWDWTDAFNKFGFGDGDGLVMTDHVAAVLRASGYSVTSEHWGMHNIVITSIRKGGIEQIPGDFDYRDGDPRKDLPATIVSLLDRADYRDSATVSDVAASSGDPFQKLLLEVSVAIDQLTDLGIDLDGEAEATLAGIRLRLEEALRSVGGRS